MTLAGTLLLTGCAVDAKPADSSAADPVSSVPAASSSMTDAQISEAALEDLVTKLSMPKQKMSIRLNKNDTGYMIFNEKGFISYDASGEEDPTGVILNSQAWIGFTATDSGAVLEGVAHLNKEAVPYYWGKDIADLGKDIYEVDDANPKKFISEDEDLLAMGMAFMGMDEYSCDTVTVVVNDDSIVYAFTYGSYKIYYTFSEFGTASDPTLDALAANPGELPTPTAFSADQLTDLAKVMGEDASKLPFPSFASFAFDAGYVSKYKAFMMYDLVASASDLDTYKAQLIAAGFTFDAEESKTSDYFFTMDIAGEEDAYYAVEAYFLTRDDLKNDPSYPNGVLEIDVKKVGGSSSTTPTGELTPESVAAEINANLSAAGNASAALEYDSQYDEWITYINFGQNGAASQSLFTSVLNILLAYIPDYILTAQSEYLTSGSADYLDLAEDGSPNYVYYGVDEGHSVVVCIMICVYNGNTMAILSVYEMPSLS